MTTLGSDNPSTRRPWSEAEGTAKGAVSADSSLFDPHSYSNWLVVVIVVATALLMLSLRKKAKTKDYLRTDPGKTSTRRPMDTTVRKSVFAYRASAFRGGSRSEPLSVGSMGRLYARLLEKTRR